MVVKFLSSGVVIVGHTVSYSGKCWNVEIVNMVPRVASASVL